MLRGMYTATAGMITQQRKHDAIANNIANINTTGFKAGNTVARSFPEVLVSIMNGESDGSGQVLGRMNNGVMAEEELFSFLQGDLEETGGALDLAILSHILQDLNGNDLPVFDQAGKHVSAEGEVTFQPQAFITLMNGQGEQRYTRNGRLGFDEGSRLVTPEGYNVMGSNGQPIILNAAAAAVTASIKIDATGQLYNETTGQPIQDDDGNPVVLLISRVENPNRLIREGNGVYRINAEDEAEVSQAVLGGQVQLYQGYLERSNVDPSQSVVDMMAAYRAYEANQRMVQFYDRTLDKAVNEIGRV